MKERRKPCDNSCGETALTTCPFKIVVNEIIYCDLPKETPTEDKFMLAALAWTLVA